MKEGKSQYQEASFQKENVDMTNADMGYHNMSDRANVAKSIQEMQGAKVRTQEMGKPGCGSESTGRDY
jgi:UDP-N-acetylenolpyruvoylglucosamine reductase